MKFSEWTKRSDSHVIDNAAGSHYELLPDTAKKCIDSAVERFIKFNKRGLHQTNSEWDDELIKYINQRKWKDEIVLLARLLK